jgi:hypothetical protein
MIARSELNLLFHQDQLTTATLAGDSALPSSGPIRRPSAGFTPRTEK